MANNKMNVTHVRYSEATKVNALKLLSQGWSMKDVAKKHKTTVQSVHMWKKKYPEISTKVITSVDKTGLIKTKSKRKAKKKANTHTIILTDEMLKELNRHAREDCRTLDGQIRYYILNGIRNHHGIPF